MNQPVYPNIWGPGQIFAFSGMDGETDWSHPFVADTLEDDVGLLFHTKVPRRLWCEPQFMVVEDIEPRVVCGDCIEFMIRADRGPEFPLRYVFLDKWTVIGETSERMPPSVRAEGSAMVSTGGDVVTHSSVGEHTALVRRSYGEKVFFAFALSTTGADRAVRRARKGLKANLATLLQRRLLLYATLPQPESADERRRRTIAKAFSVLRANVETPQGMIPCRWSTPDRRPHRDMWLWDSCFHAFGYRVFSPEGAAETLTAVLAVQSADGFIPHRVSPTDVSDITQPPLLAWACFELYQHTGDRDFIERAYPQIVGFIEWVLANRSIGEEGLLQWRPSDDPLCRCDESGMDNSPRFDAGIPLAAIDLVSYVVNEMRYLMAMADHLGRLDEAEKWARRAQELARVVNEHLWDETDGFYYDRTVDGEPVRIKTAAGFLPLFAGIPDEHRAERLLEHLQNPQEFWTAFPVPSVAVNEDRFEPDMWRGPTWVNVDLMIILGLRRYAFADVARELTEKLLAGIEHWYCRLGAICEFYDPLGRTPPNLLDRKQRLRTGQGIAPIADYNWSAACYLALATNTA